MDIGTQSFSQMKHSKRKQEEDAAEALSMRLLAIEDDDSDEEDRVLRESFSLLGQGGLADETDDDVEYLDHLRIQSTRSTLKRNTSVAFRNMMDYVDEAVEEKQLEAQRKVCTMVALAITAIITVVFGFYVTVQFIGPPSQPVGPYSLIERQEGESFFDYYSFYEGPDSVGSNGYLQYVGKQYATFNGILNVSYEEDILRFHESRRATTVESENKIENEPFVYIGTAPTAAGPRDSIRLEGNRRFDRGLFIIDIRHMPAGCGVWPAFWLTDEANWPVNGEIDIVEGVNYQNVAKTALHSTKGCSMTDIPLGTMTGEWDTAQGIPDKKTGIPDMTLRYAQNCFVYDPHQWLNQGCVAVDKKGGTLGQPVNDNGGGVYVLEWDPIFRHIRTWVFTPHSNVPDNLVSVIRTASLSPEERVNPDPDSWPIPYGYFAIGEETDCPTYHFRHMRLVLNTAFCGSVSGNRFQLDCPLQAKNFSTCNDWVKSNPPEMAEAYWKIRGVYVYQREWRSTWLY